MFTQFCKVVPLSKIALSFSALAILSSQAASAATPYDPKRFEGTYQLDAKASQNAADCIENVSFHYGKAADLTDLNSFPSVPNGRGLLIYSCKTNPSYLQEFVSDQALLTGYDLEVTGTLSNRRSVESMPLWLTTEVLQHRQKVTEPAATAGPPAGWQTLWIANTFQLEKETLTYSKAITQVVYPYYGAITQENTLAKCVYHRISQTPDGLKRR